MVNLPNALTLLRMCLIPVFVALYYSAGRPWALVVYLIAGLTDVLDGYLARKWNQITSFGKLMDPLADKLMMLAMAFCLTDTGYIPLWVPVVLLGKELLMVAGSALLLGKRKVVVMANWAGKVATASLIAAVVLVFPWHPWEIVRTVGRVLMYAAVVFSLYAMVNYARLYVKKPSDDKAD